MPVAQTAFIDLATRYSKAWNDRDVEGILAVHADDSIFHVHGTGPPAKFIVATQKVRIR